MTGPPLSSALPFGFGASSCGDDAEAAPLRAVLDLAAAAERLLGVSRAFAEAGRPVDLTGLQLWIGRLTAGVLDLRPEDGRRLSPVLHSLLASLDLLQGAVIASAPEGLSP